MSSGWFPKLEKAFWKQQALYGSVYRATLCYCLQMLEQTRRNKRAALKLMRKLLKKYGLVPDKLVTDDLRSYGAQPVILESQNAMNAVEGATTERRIHINRPDEGRGRCKGSRASHRRKDFSQCMQQSTTPSTSNVILHRQERTEPFGPRL